MNIIYQRHSSFRSPYGGENSLRPEAEHATSRLLTLYTGIQASPSTELLLDLESAGGRGISDALGLAGFTNLDVVRNPTLGAKPYLARMMLHHVVALTRETVENDRSALSLSKDKPVRRFEFRLGKLSTADFFDTNAAGSDSHLQFMNWTVDNNGAFDYAADTRGYTYGGVVEYDSAMMSIRFGEMLMPKVANGIHLDWNLRRAHSENAELELRPRAGTIVRLLNYENHANMGSYREATAAFAKGVDKQPDIEAHRRQGRLKYGFGVNVEQSLSQPLRLFGRWGWNEGKNESFAYTEVNESMAVGGDLRGVRWRRPEDKVGAAVVVNAISGDHRRYLQLGGLGFLLGDGTLNYGREQILESYYTFHLWRGVSVSLDIQHIRNPGYNHDRGPVSVASGRLHFDL